ncbi:MAG: phytoene desaturase [Candidatus Omnitrophica bacterium]|nr:phytoene desaturase [Candidatus Omnitrophota bacterium]
MPSKNGKHVIVIGAGLGGMSAALSLALEGCDVSVFEKNDKVGGKLNMLSAGGYQFDLGPSILTLPHIFAGVFEQAGKRMEDYVHTCTVRPHWRSLFEDGTIIDLFPEQEKMDAEARKVGEPPENVHQFLAYSERLYDLVNRGYFEQGLDTAADFRRFYGLAAFPKFDLFRSMHQSVRRHFKTRYFIDIFDFFIKYVGSSAYRAPAFMNCMSTIQFRYDLWYVMGGMYRLAQGLERLMHELGIRIELNAEIHEILLSDDRSQVRGIRLADGREILADAVVSNLEVIPTYRRLLNEDEAVLKKMQKRLEPACSGLVIDIGLDCKYENLAHHNFFFSNNQKKHFQDVFKKQKLPGDPTLYVVAASRTDPSVAPEGCDCIKILPHIPYINQDNPAPHEEYVALKERVLDKMERMGCPELRRHIVFEHFWTPHDIENRYYSNCGSIYGVVSDRFKNLAFKAPKASSKYQGLFFVGGSVNPGGGMPMVFLCGRNAAKTIVKTLQDQDA